MLDSVTNYECYKGLWSSHNDKNYFEIDYSINRQSGANGGIYRNIDLYNFVDNHDVNRLASTLHNNAHLPLVYTLMYTMPGIPSIYYGSEYGIEGRKENNSDDNLRPCLHLNDLADHGNTSLYRHIVKLGRIYRSYPALRTGSYERIMITNQQLLFKKVQGDHFQTHLSGLVDVFTAEPLHIDNGNVNVRMRPYTAMIIVADDIVNTEPEEAEIIPDKDTEIVIGGKYRHFKGNEYELIAVARHSETMEELVIYKSLKDGEVWARPKSMFIGKAGDVRRFTKID
jgi:hypothetical protein